MSDNVVTRKSWVDRFLDGIERVCNKLPPPAIIFVWLFFIAAIVGAVITVTGFTMVNPATGKVVASQNLFTGDGMLWFMSNLIKNFTGFAPLGLVLTMTLAIGMCEESGLILALLHKVMKNVPPVLVPFVIAFIGTVGNIASDTAMVIVPPMAALVYIGVGKHPVVGMINGYAGAQAGFTANLMIAGTDSLLQGLTNVALKGFLPAEKVFEVDVSCNWYFMFVSVFLCAIVIGWVCTSVVEPRMGKWVPEEGSAAAEEAGIKELSPREKKAMRCSGLVAVVYLAFILAMFFYGPLAKIAKDGSRVFVGSPLLKGLIPVLFLFFYLPGATYGFVSGNFKSSADLNVGMTKQMKAMGGYVVFCFFAGQFNMLFNWTKLGTMLAIGGANFLKAIGFTGIPMCIAFILVCAFVNLFVSSGSAKWAIFAPIFVPMFMLMGYHPGFTQLLYRLGDSPSNCFTPTTPYIWMVLSVAQAKYMKDIKIGTLVSNLIPIAVVLQIAWIIMFVVWAQLGWDIGPGVNAALPPGIL